ncbi:MAG: FkbM family methyltransferase [bacterium]|nr:FkbM family methyltransferase [bacterium]
MIDERAVFSIRNAKFYLPHYKTDIISANMVNSKDYWDNWQGGALGIIDKYLKDKSVIIDIGANIGSHTVYWAIERKAKRIYSFEPLPDTFDILQTNIQLNLLNKIVKLYNVGLSDEECRQDINHYDEGNIGNTIFAKKKGGGFIFKPLDSFCIKEKVDLIKIDVEGAEVEVLVGAKNTILLSHPVIVIESFNRKQEVDVFMHEIGYKQIETIRENEDYIYEYAG